MGDEEGAADGAEGNRVGALVGQALESLNGIIVGNPTSMKHITKQIKL